MKTGKQAMVAVLVTAMLAGTIPAGLAAEGGAAPLEQEALPVVEMQGVQPAPESEPEPPSDTNVQAEDGLIVHYDFKSLASGTIVNDISGNGLAAEVMPRGSGVQTEQVMIYGKEETAIVLQGGQPGDGHNYVEMPQGVLNDLEDLTISCWVYVTSMSGYNRIWDLGSGTTSYLYLLADGYNAGHTGYTAALTKSGWGAEKGPEKGSNLATGVWKLTTVTFDGSEKTMRLYEDGVQIGDAVKTDADLSVLQGSTQNWIGYGQFKNDILNGMIADFRIYNRALSGEEVAGMFTIPDNERVSRDKNSLTLGDTSAVTGDLSLPVKGTAGSAIAWESSDASVITDGGVVTRPATGRPDAQVTLTATISSGAISDTKVFTVTVLHLPSDQEAVDADAAAIDLGNLGAVTEDLTLPAVGNLGSTITWKSSNENCVSANGTVTRPVGLSAQVTVTATVRKGEISKERAFTVTILPLYEKLDIVKVPDVAVSTVCGIVPSLPATVTVTFEDGTIGTVKAVWPTGLTGSGFGAAGTKTLEGSLVGHDNKVNAVVTVIDEEEQAPAAITESFDLSDISLDGTDTIYGENMARALEYLKLMDADRMLYNFRKTFGQDTKGAQALTGWDAPTGLLRGHSTGHFMSALAQAYASTGDEVYKTKLDYMISEMRKLQELSEGDAAAFTTRCTPTDAAQTKWSTTPNTWGEGFISAYSPDQFALLEQYTPYNTIWAPYYTMHKLLAGFLDSYLYAGNEEGLMIAKDLGLWVYNRLSACTKEQRERMWSMYIAGEYGGMNESLARLYELTEDARYLTASQMFDNKDFFDGLSSNEDTIENRHANQHIPQIVGAVHEYAATGDVYYYDIAKHFWEMATARYAYSIGGVGTGERFKNPYAQGKNILGNDGRGENCETCAAYNMLKLTQELYNYDPDNAAYMDYYERTVLNQIASSQSHDVNSHMHNGVTYMLPIDPGQRRDYDSDYGGFTCCNGTGMENHVHYQAAAYAKTDDTLYVNLYMPTTVKWDEKNITVKQETSFPSEDSSLTVTGSGSFKMKLRVPYWATEGFTVKVNGEVVCTEPTPSSYVLIDRTWKSGDVVTIHMPYTLHLDKTPDTVDGAEVASLMYGPMVMVAKDDRSSYIPMNWYTLSLSDTNLVETAQIETPAGGDSTPHLVVDGLNFYPMYDAYNYRYHAYVKLMEPQSILNPEWLQALVDSVTGDNALTETDYEADLWAAYQTELSAAQAVLEKGGDATQTELYDAQVALQNALDAMHYKWTVTFETNGGSEIAVVKVENGSKLTAPSIPTKSGYTFDGWYKDAKLTEAWSFDTDLVTQSITLYAKWNQNPTYSDSTPGNKTKTTKNPDGSTTTTVTKPDGTVTETTKWADGSTNVVETRKDGSVKQSGQTADGVKGETTKTSDGTMNATATVPAKAADSANAVTLPILPVEAGKSTIIVSAPANKSVKVVVPMQNVKPGTVAVLVKADGAEEIIKTAVPTEGGIALAVQGNVTIKVMDNTKRFNDMSENNWAYESVTFVTARELFNGISATSFGAGEPMTRGMLMTVLARLDGQDTAAGSTWYEAGMGWAREQGISDGTAPEGNLTREQLVTMLYRYAGSPKTADTAMREFSDADSVSSYAAEAMEWAVENSIVNGKNGALDPQGQATRAEVAAILQRFVGKL